jgi:hypothetical protein
MSATQRNAHDDSVNFADDQQQQDDTFHADAVAPRRRVGTRAGILAGLTLGAIGAAYGASVTTVSAGHIVL